MAHLSVSDPLMKKKRGISSTILRILEQVLYRRKEICGSKLSDAAITIIALIIIIIIIIIGYLYWLLLLDYHDDMMR